MSRHNRRARARAAVVALLMISGVGAAAPGNRPPLDAAAAAPRSLPAARPAVNPVFRPILPRLAGVGVPVLLPTYIPRQRPRGPRLYATVDDRGPYSYFVDIGYMPDCRGATACRLGQVTGGPEIDTPTIFDYPRGRQVRLRGGALALYYPYTCGASCGDSVLVFQREGVVYTVGVKAGSLGDVLAMANSVAPALAP